MALATNFGQRLRTIRDRRDYTQGGLAKIAKINTTQLAHFEADQREPSAKNIRKLARALDVSADFLLGLSDDTSRISG